MGAGLHLGPVGCILSVHPDKLMTAARSLERLGTLADSTRSRLLLVLEGMELTVGELCTVLQLPQSTVSRHLKILSDEGWVVSRDAGASRFYTLVPARLDRFSRKLWLVVRDQVSSSAAAQQDTRRRQSVLNARRGEKQTFFSGAAANWDQLRTTLIGTRTDLLAALDLLDPSWTVGDLGCGTGHLTEAIAPIVDRVVAVDESGAMLATARRRLATFENVDVRSGSIEELPVEDSELDVALIFMVLQFVLEPAAALREVRRALKPAGRAVVVDLTPHEHDDYALKMGHVWQGFTEEQMRGWCTDAGVSVVRYRVLPADPKAKGPALFSMLVTNSKR
jgi:ubiquinone/menaquinone biosynthesis C-methylase UbiE/DNA-binding transcriptional ArsR family regulator